MEALQKPFLSCTDIASILSCSSSKASRIRQEIQKRLAKDGKQLLTNDVPTKLFIEIMCLDTSINERGLV